MNDIAPQLASFKQLCSFAGDSQGDRRKTFSLMCQPGFSEAKGFGRTGLSDKIKLFRCAILPEKLVLSLPESDFSLLA